MRGYALTVILGNVTKDLELKTTENGLSVVNISVAVNNKDDKVSYIDCVAWRGAAESLAKYVRKGDPILLEGTLEQHTWEKDGMKRSKLELIINRYVFLPSKDLVKDTSEKPWGDILPSDEDIDKPVDLSDIPF